MSRCCNHAASRTCRGLGACYAGYPLGDGEREGGQSQPTRSDLEARGAALAHLRNDRIILPQHRPHILALLVFILAKPAKPHNRQHQ